MLHGVLNFGPLSLFAAALVSTDSVANHLRGHIFYIAWVIKVLYPLVSACLSINILLMEPLHEPRTVWIGTRLVITVCWLSAVLWELVYWRSAPIPEVEGIEYDEAEIEYTESDLEPSTAGELEKGSGERAVYNILNFQESTEDVRE